MNTPTESEQTANILSYWPMKHSAPRKSQEEVLAWVETLPSHIKYILCEMPVGGGKSPLALNLSGWLAKSKGNSYILTPQKVLQKQYEDSFERDQIHSLYGKSNYKCESKGTNCEIGSDIKPRCEECPHKSAFQRVMYSPNVVLNYSLGLLLFKYVLDEKIITKRKLIVFDEAHTLETHLTEFNAIIVSEFRCKQIGGIAFKQFTTMRYAHEWMRDAYLPALLSKISKLNPVVQEIIETCNHSGASPSREEMNSIALLKELTNHREMIQEQLMIPDFETIYADYVLVNEGKTAFKFKELYGKRNFRQFVEPMADKFLFMTSTILDKVAFCEDLGLDPSQAAFISLDSEFDIDNRPIFYMPTSKMAFGWDKPDRKKETDKILFKIRELCTKMHDEDSGIIHAGSFQIAKWLVENLENKVPHMIMHHNPGSGKTRDVVLAEFQELDGVPKLLISPSITEGLDLVGDKGRFAIFAKVPFPFLGDAWVKKRMDLSDSWYKRQALIAMIQGGGRIVRSSDDWGHVYILDSSFGYLLSQSKSMVPEWWRESIRTL
jgi:ATP-dependent DNA helicase DinG